MHDGQVPTARIHSPIKVLTPNFLLNSHRGNSVTASPSGALLTSRVQRETSRFARVTITHSGQSDFPPFAPGEVCATLGHHSVRNI